MANNRIPRNAKKIYITWKVDTTGNKSGDRATVEKTERGWIETTENGNAYYMPLALLRNADVVQVDQIETDEPNNRKDVLLSDVGTQVYIIDGASRTDKAAQAVISALCNSGRITGELAERAKSDRATLDKIKRNLLHVQMEERETETGKRWTFYTQSGVYMDIPAYSRNYIIADKYGALYQDAQNAPTAEEPEQDKEITTREENEPQRATETAKKTIRTGERLYSHPHRHMVTVEGLQGDLVRVIYRGHLYLVCCSDLYTDETETTPAQMETAAERGTVTAGRTKATASDIMTTVTAMTATQHHRSHHRTQWRATATASRRATQDAHRRTERHQPEQVHVDSIKTPYRAKWKAESDHRSDNENGRSP